MYFLGGKEDLVFELKVKGKGVFVLSEPLDDEFPLYEQINIEEQRVGLTSSIESFIWRIPPNW